MTIHPAWLPPSTFHFLTGKRFLIDSDHPLAGTVREELLRAGCGPAAPGTSADLTFTVVPSTTLSSPSIGVGDGDGFTLTGSGVEADGPRGLIYGLFELARGGLPGRYEPAFTRRMIDHWDNVDVHPVMGQVERGYSGGSIFWKDGVFLGSSPDGLKRIRTYARLLAAAGINAVTVNNVNVHRTEARLLTDRRGEVAVIADQFRRYGIVTHLSVNFAAPVILGDLPTADPLDPRVQQWWAATSAQLVSDIADFGGYLVKADSEGQPGPFTYGRSHAEGANMLAAALTSRLVPSLGALRTPGPVVHWRAFVYDHRQDWRDRTTDRARAAYDHFAPLDGLFADNVIVQVKHGPIDFQPREPLSPVLTAMPRTRLAVELQATQEYTGQQRHVCYLAPMWSEVLAQVDGEMATVANTGDDIYWTGHPLAQANLYAAGRLAWNPDPIAVLDEWIDLTFPRAPSRLRSILHELMDTSLLTYEQYTAPLGVGFMVRPGHHYGPDVDGYEYTPWGTYHFADRDGVGVDRTSATGTAFAAQYPHTWYESPATCPDELLLFFHHVPYTHVLHSGTTVIQHIYDTHFEGATRVESMRDLWRSAAALVDPDLHARVAARLDEQVRSATEWRDQINAYFHRKSGIPDAHGRRIH
ncbi:alpha-glucuronidase [Actinoplanes derwentensis]|uniref:Alpha-glucuronidase n=1 Tax=Actinoplanes derwentensis TaxID=113562 RepID=A0A1H1YYT7_9ACTN|nr:alpha-glucuronidase [Actinoplanes derwentensis]GID81347.1 xylan alpha-(1->2)-glucuronosidase [Actinoplanes derwentensis]SDT26482.1 alpha-glucuronidase [Actinoplanes derwentensis]